MKTTIKNTLAATLLTGAVAVSGLTACSSSDDSIAEEPTPVVNPAQPQTYRVSIPATIGGDAETRAVSFSGTESTSTFSTSERVYVYNVTTGKALDGYLQPTNLSADSKSCDLSGTLTGTLSEGDNIKLLYNLEYYNVNYINNQSNPSYCFFSCDEQDGTASGVRDGAMATATVGTYAGSGTLTTTDPASFTNVQSMFRFQFTDGTSLINVKLLRITSENEAVSELYYPLITNGSKYNYAPINVTLANATTEYIYVALCFDESKTSDNVLNFRVQDADGYIYEGSKPAPTGGFKNGKYYWNSSAITLTKTGQLVKPTLSRSDGGKESELENADEDNIFFIWGSRINNAWVPINVTMSGTSIGYGFYFNDGGKSTTVNLNGLNATFADDNTFIYSQSGTLTLNLTGSNSISCSNYDETIYSKGDLKLSGNGTLTVTANATSYYGLSGSNYQSGSNSDPSVLAAPDYTVTRSAVTNNQDGTYTWTYTVAPTNQ